WGISIYLADVILSPLLRNSSVPRPVPLKHPQSIIDSGCLTVGIMNRSLYLAPVGLLTNCLVMPNWWNELSSDHITLIQASAVQARYCFAKFKRFFLMAAVSFGLRLEHVHGGHSEAVFYEQYCLI